MMLSWRNTLLFFIAMQTYIAQADFMRPLEQSDNQVLLYLYTDSTNNNDGWQVQRRFVPIDTPAPIDWADWGESTYYAHNEGQALRITDTLDQLGFFSYRARTVQKAQYDAGACGENGACNNSGEWIGTLSEWLVTDRIDSTIKNNQTYWEITPGFYYAYAGAQTHKNIYEGNNVVFYTDDTLSKSEYAGILEHLDSCMALYDKFTPNPYPVFSATGFEGKGSVAITNIPCSNGAGVLGAACGAGGRVEVARQFYEEGISNADGDLSDPLGWQLTYYEMGRGSNFAFQEAMSIPSNIDVGIGSGFPWFMASACMHKMGASFADQIDFFEANGSNPPAIIFDSAFWDLNISFKEFLLRDNPELTLNPDEKEAADGNRRGINTLYAMLLSNIYIAYGEEYTQAFLQALADMDAAETPDDVEQNLYDAAHFAFLDTGVGRTSHYTLKTLWNMSSDLEMSNYIGGLDLDATCRSQTNNDSADAVLTVSNPFSSYAAYKWACEVNGSQTGISMTQACIDTYDDYSDVYAFSDNLHSAYSWRCHYKK